MACEDGVRDLDAIRDDWTDVALTTGPADRSEAEAGACDAYRAVGLEPPAVFVWLDSPAAGALGVHMLTYSAAIGEKRILDRGWAQIQDQVWSQVQGWGQDWTESETARWSRLRSAVGEPVVERVWSQSFDRVREQSQKEVDGQILTRAVDHAARNGIWSGVWEHVRAQVREQIGTGICASVPGQRDAEWLAAYDYFRTHCSVAAVDQLTGVMRVARSAGQWWPFRNAVFLTERPTAIHRDSDGRLHSETGPAVVYPDGFALWAWHGVRLSEEPTRTRPVISRDGADFESDALVVRTDYSDDEAWRSVVDLLNRPVDGNEIQTHLVDDPAFEGADPGEVVLSALAGDARLQVVFLADAAAMRGEHTLIAASTRSQDLDDEGGDEELPREFRLVPSAVNLVHVNLAIGNLDFYEFSYGARRSPEGILRW
ncbi:hypothetical protein J8N05_14590 [Streptomyces sp. BH-SS-21]|uniref:Uncharacterized protein n=1 Tax=Streptomyces liliiviolaceus TaxID=2823109 RepID=A0A941B3N8_9ACTN|nr:hypothetical protein [Streptomyces liliiviolaceus]MBQ0849430.1 hypothetical protein [Streptomyces liliiviolaceus]